jgi:hypothetical protein
MQLGLSRDKEILPIILATYYNILLRFSFILHIFESTIDYIYIYYYFNIKLLIMEPPYFTRWSVINGSSALNPKKTGCDTFSLHTKAPSIVC